MSSPHKREHSTRMKNSTSGRTSHNLTFYKRDVEEFRPEDAYIERRILESQVHVTHELARQRTVEELEKKVQIVLRHNSHLLAQNASLGELLAERNAELDALHEKLEVQMRGESTNLLWIEVEKKRLLDDIDKRQSEHNEQIRKLLDEVSKLHGQCYEIQNAKNLEIQKLKQQYEKETFNQIQILKRSQNGNIELYEVQVRTLKQQLQQHKFQSQNKNHQNKLHIDKLNEELKSLQSQIKHLNKIRQLELNECRIHYENEAHSKVRELEHKQQLEAGNNESILRRLRKELGDKTMEIERLGTRLGSLTQENESELHILKAEKESLRQEIERVEESSKAVLRQERQKMKKMTEMEIQNLQNANTNYTNSLKSEVEKLFQLNECKTGEIRKLFEQLQSLRQSNREQIDNLNKLNEQLRIKMNELQRRYIEQLELLKIKMAHLHQADIKSLKQYYQNQLRIQAEQILQLQRQLAEARDKVHKELQEKNELRKEFELELSKEKAKNADLRVKLAALSVEMKEQVTSMTSKMELTSQTLLRQADLKQKGQVFHDEQKRKLHHLINAKDKQISDLRDDGEKFRKEKEAEIVALRSELTEVRNFNKQLEAGQLKDRNNFENEVKKRQVKSRQEIDSLKKELETLKTVDMLQLKTLIETLQKDNIKLVKELEHSQRQHKNILVELGIRNGYIETVQLQSMAAINEERDKVKILMNKNEMSMKNYYEDKIMHKDKEIAALKEQLIQKETDIRDLVTKYGELQRKMRELLETQQKLRNFEERVMNLGMDNNLVKNMAELFRARA